jgi:hypothetical protein
MQLGLGITMAPPGINLGNIGGGLNWNIHGEGKPAGPVMPDAPDNSLIGMGGVPPSEAHVALPKGDVYVQNSNNFGEFTSKVQVYDLSGKLMGEGTASGRDPWKAQSEAVAKATAEATPEAAAEISGAVTAETQAQAQAKLDAAAKEEAARVAKEKADKEAKEKAEKEKKEKEKADGGAGHTDPGADAPVDPSTLTSAEVAALIAANDGSTNTHVGNTGVILEPGDYVDPNILIINVEPDADADQTVAPNTPPPCSGACPEFDPRLPQGPEFGGGVPSRGGQGGGLH